jgi:hypothetical protein
MAVSTPAKRGFARPLIIALLVIVVVAVLGYGYASPYLALNRLKRAADERDAQTVSEYVDYPALRESLKEQIAGLLTRKIQARANGNPLAALGAMIGVALIGPLVDAYATPDGVAALLNGMPPRGDPTQRPPLPPDAPANAPAGSADSTPAPSAPATAGAATPRRNRRRRRPPIVASMNSSSRIGTAWATRAMPRFCGAKDCSRGSWRRWT